MKDFDCKLQLTSISKTVTEKRDVIKWQKRKMELKLSKIEVLSQVSCTAKCQVHLA